MKKLILIALCLGLMALGSVGSAEAYTQSGITNWKAGDTISLNFNLPANFDNLIGAWLNISSINDVSNNDHVKVNGQDRGVISMNSDGVLHTTKFDLKDFFANNSLTGQPLHVSIYADGPLSLHSSMLELEYAYFAEPTNGNNNSAPVPEPATLLLLGSGLSGLAFWGKRRRVEV